MVAHALHPASWVAGWQRYGPGLMACAVVAAAANFLALHYGAPAMLFGLLLGMAMNFLSQSGPCLPGIALASTRLLRIGVALLGLRITVGQVGELGWPVVGGVMAAVLVTMALGALLARGLGFQSTFGLLTGGAVGICGASAAMAITAVLPAHPLKERATLFTVIGVSALSTLAMVVYPIVGRWAGLSDHETGIFLGATIHDVAKVVGAGYGVSTQAGDTATVVKLLRVAMLVPIVVVLAMHFNRGAAADEGGTRALPIPVFALAFAALVAVRSLGWVPPAGVEAANDISRWCLVTAIAAIGLKSRLQDIATVGLRPVVLMVGETVFLAALVVGALRLLR